MSKHSNLLLSNSWSIFEAKTKLSELIEQTIKKGPQTITKRGEPTVVVVPFAQFEEMTTPQPDFKAFLMTCPIENLEFERNPTLPRVTEW